MIAALREIELKILHVLTCDIESPLADGVAAYVSELVLAATLFALVLLVLVLSPARRPRVVRMLLAVVLAAAAAGAVKEVLWRVAPRDRPGKLFTKDQVLIGPIERRTCADHPGMWVERGYEPRSSSFPSSHTIFAAAVAATVGFAFPWLAGIAWLYAVLVGISRLYYGKHWPSDVLGSLLLGALLGWLAWRWAPRVQAWAGKRLAARRAKPCAPQG